MTPEDLGDVAEQHVPRAVALVGAVHDGGPGEVGRVLSDETLDLRVMCVVLAAMVNPDARPSELLEWVPPLDRPAPHTALLFGMPEEPRVGRPRQERRRQAEPAPTVALDMLGRVSEGHDISPTETEDLTDDLVRMLHGAYRRGDKSRGARAGYLEWERRRVTRRRQAPDRRQMQSTG